MVLLASDRPPSKYFRHTLTQRICADAEEQVYIQAGPRDKGFRHIFAQANHITFKNGIHTK